MNPSFPDLPLFPDGNLSLPIGPDTFSLPCDANAAVAPPRASLQ